jgi:hypothetical protein
MGKGAWSRFDSSCCARSEALEVEVYTDYSPLAAVYRVGGTIGEIAWSRYDTSFCVEWDTPLGNLLPV